MKVKSFKNACLLALTIMLTFISSLAVSTLFFKQNKVAHADPTETTQQIVAKPDGITYNGITFSNGVIYSLKNNAETNTDRVVMYYDGNPYDYLQGKTTNPYPVVTFSSPLTGVEGKFAEPNGNSGNNITLSNNTLNVNDFGIYTISATNSSSGAKIEIVIYSFGVKNLYRNENSTNENLNDEFTYFDDTTTVTSRIGNGKDVDSTYIKNHLTIFDKVKTNQVPVWFNNWCTIENPSNKSINYLAPGKDNFEPYTGAEIISQPGKYFVSVTFKAPSLLTDLNGLASITNNFVFEIGSSNPVLTYNATNYYKSYDKCENAAEKTTTTLTSDNAQDSFSNGHVVIKSTPATHFDKPYTITYSAETFNAEGNKIDGYTVTNKEYTDGEELSTPIKSGTTSELLTNCYTQYTITINFGTSQSYVASRFTIDKTQINFKSYFGVDQDALKSNKETDAPYTLVDVNASNSFYIADANSKLFLNNIQKASGAAVTATVRYFGFSANATSETFDNGGKTYVVANYKPDDATKFTPYALGEVTASGNLIGDMAEGLSAPGLYQFEILDSAYNTTFYYAYIDQFTPNIVVNSTNTSYEIIYGDYKALELNGNIKLYNRTKNETTNGLIVSNNSKYYLVTAINTINNDYPNTIPEGWQNKQSIRNTEDGNVSGYITKYEYTENKLLGRNVTHDRITINSKLKANEGTFSYGVEDANHNKSVSGQFSISFDLANVNILAKQSETDNANNYYGGKFANLASGAKATGTSFNVVEFDESTVNTSALANGDVPAFTLTSIVVKYYEKLASGSTYYSTTPTSTVVLYENNAFTHNKLPANNSITSEGKYEFIWNIDLANNVTDAAGKELYDRERSQFVVIDRTDWFNGLANPQLTFQAGKDDAKSLGLKTSDANKNIANIVNGRLGNTTNLNYVTNSNLTPIGFNGIREYRVNKDAIGTTDIDNLIYELFKINVAATATNNGSVVDGVSDLKTLTSKFISKGSYNVSLSDGFNDLIMFNAVTDNGQTTGERALGAGVNFKFNINRISPSANFVDGNNEGFGDPTSSLSAGNGIFTYNQVKVESGKYVVTNINSNIASVNPEKDIQFSFDKDYVYDPLISLGAAQFDKTHYPQNATIDLEKIVVKANNLALRRVTNEAQLASNTYMITENTSGNYTRYSISLNHLAEAYEGNCKVEITLSYKGSASDFGVAADESKFLTETYTLYIDSVAPSHNLNRVKAGDPIYQSITKSDLNVSETDLEKYVYVIDDKFEFEKAEGETSYLDTYKIFYRDTRIGSGDDYTFNENNTSLYKAFNYNRLVNDILSYNVVYQIVELDLAGNETSYFVCLKGSQSITMGVTVENYKENADVLSTYTRTVSANNNNESSFYSYNGEFRISSLAAVNNFILYQVYDVTDSANVKSLTAGSAYNNPNRLGGNYVITTNANILSDAIWNCLNEYSSNSNWKTDGAIFEVKIYDRLNSNNTAENAEWINFKLYFRPSGKFDFSGNATNDVNGYIYTNANNNIIIKNPTFNASYSYDSYYVYKLPDVNNPTEIANKSEASAGETTIVPTNNDDNYKLYVRDCYGQVIEKYFSAVADYANFASTATTTPFVVTEATGTQIDSIRDKIAADENLSQNIPATEIAGDHKVALGIYSDNLSFVYHNTFRHVEKVEVCTNVYANNLVFNDITDDKTYVTIDEIKGEINFKPFKKSFMVYKVTTAFDSLLNDDTKETYYAVYYTIMPELMVYDSSQIKLSFSGENQDTIRTTFANVNYQLDEMDDLLNTYVTLRETNTRIDGEEVYTDEVEVDKTIALRISNTNFKKRVFTFTIRNLSGRVETYNVIIDSTRYPDYQFIKTTNGVEETLLVSSRPFSEKVSTSAAFNTGEQFFTNDRANTRLILAEDKPLTARVVKGLNPATGEIVNVVDGSGEVISAGSSNYTIYLIYSTDDSTYSYNEYKKITYVPVSTTLAGFNDVGSSITTTDQTYTLRYNTSNYTVDEALDIYATIVDSTSGQNAVIDRTGTITLSDAGIYNVTYKDIAGNTHMFANNATSQAVNIINKVLYTVSSANYSGELVDSMVLENYATVNLLNPNLYSTNDLSIVATYNGSEFEMGTTDTFYNAGVYTITVSGRLRDTGATVPLTTYTIYLVKPNEQRLGLEYVANNIRNTSSQVVGAYRSDSSLSTSSGTNVINVFRGKENILTTPNAPLTRLRMSPYESGTGYYTITIATAFQSEYKTAFNYTFHVLILDIDPIIKCNIEFGGSTSKNIVLTWVPSEMFESYGEISILLNGETIGDITEADKFNTEANPYIINAAGTYNIDITTSSGLILARYVVTKTEPLSTVAIILIVVGAAALVAGVLLFFLLRNKMRVK